MSSAGAYFNGGQNPLAPQPASQIDLNCRNQCLDRGNLMQYCSKACSY